MVQKDAFLALRETLPAGVTLVAVSKTKPVADIQALYDLGQRDFGENYVQELLEKQPVLPGDIRWHFIGHLQSNKVKYIAPFVHLIHGVDSLSLLKEIHKQGVKHDRVIDCLLQVHIALEETKFGFDRDELPSVLDHTFTHARLRGMMGMASNSLDRLLVREEFEGLAALFGESRRPGWDTLSMGMSADYGIAVECGSTLVRIGSLLFGSR
jgi:pyridoxal phosphate enzyme (YggS family)